MGAKLLSITFIIAIKKLVLLLLFKGLPALSSTKILNLANSKVILFFKLKSSLIISLVLFSY